MFDAHSVAHEPVPALPAAAARRPLTVMVIGLNYAPEVISTGKYTTGLAEGLAEAGHRVHVVAGHPYYPGWAHFPGVRPWRYHRTPATGASASVTRCPHYVPARPTGIRRILHHLSFAASALPVALWTALRHRPDLVIGIAPPLLTTPVAWLAARLVGAKCWLHLQDIEVEAAIATRLLPARGPATRLALAVERWILGRFDRISTISPPMRRALLAKGLPSVRVTELRNWADLDRVRPLEGPSPLTDELGLRGRKVALYAGNLAIKQGLEILPALARALAHRSDIALVVAGEGPGRAALETAARDLPNLKLLPLQPLDRLSDLLGLADLHLLPQIAGAADLVLPSKLTNMLASGRPVIATTPRSSALAVEIGAAGLVTPPGDAPSLALAVEALLDDPARRLRMGRIARARAEARWDRSAVLGKAEREMARLCPEPPDRARPELKPQLHRA